MRSILAVGTLAFMVAGGCAKAADLAYLPAGIAPLEAVSWSGCYVGTHSGLAAGHTTWQDALPLGTIDATTTGQTANSDMSGAIYGAQGGCDYQINRGWVIGLEGSFAAATLTGTNMDQFNATWSLRSKDDWLGSITGRVGFAVDRALIYWRAGVAWAHNKFEIENTAIPEGTPQTTRVGWIIGSGIEFALAPCWSVFLEADYYSFNGTTMAFAGDRVNPTPSFGVNTTQNVEAMKFGLNYRFGGAPVASLSRY